MKTENENLSKWTPAARAVAEPNHPQLPHHVLMGEAVDVAGFFETYWKAQVGDNGEIIVPGLELAARDGLLAENLGQEVYELQDATQASQARYRLTVAAPNESEMERAEYVLGELRSVLEFLFDDKVDDEDDVRLERLQDAHGYPRSQDAMASALDEFALLGAENRERIRGLGGFEAALIDEATELAHQLRKRSARRITGATPKAQREALDLRNRLATLLYERMQRIRTAARFVFRNDPERARRATSAYERQKRARYRQEQAETELAPSVAQATAE